MDFTKDTTGMRLKVHKEYKDRLCVFSVKLCVNWPGYFETIHNGWRKQRKEKSCNAEIF